VDFNGQHNCYSALDEASRRGYTEIVRLLLESGADVNTHGIYALDEASGGGHTEIVRLLLESGADVNNGVYALRAAQDNGHLEIVDLLLGKRAKPATSGQDAGARG